MQKYVTPILSVLLVAISQPLIAQGAGPDLQTLFTTPQERRLIDDNRYKVAPTKKPRRQEAVKIVKVEEEIKQEVSQDFTISGFTVAASGQHVAWLNGQAVENGQKLDGKYRVRVLSGKENRVQITTPDGKNFYGTSGDTVAVKYLEVVE